MPRLEARDVVMQFPAVRALDGVSVSFQEGEVHGIVGENGAGKSTLMRILSGILQPTSGAVMLDGEEIRFHSVKDALKSGIAMIHQELDLVEDLSASENVFLGSEPLRFGLIRKREMIERTRALLDRVGARFQPTARVAELSVAGKQLVEIAKALSYNARILIMDEPTAVLTDRETDSLFSLIEELRLQGVTVIYISHRLSEVERICDRITVLRDGVLVRTLAKGEAGLDEIANLMVGRELSDLYPAKRLPTSDEIILAAADFAVEGHVVSASLRVRAGEILGIAGLIGAGRTEFAEAIFGARTKTRGGVFVGGGRTEIRSPQEAMRVGIAYVSEDRKGIGLVSDLNVAENCTLANLRSYCTPLLSKSEEMRAAERWKQKLDIRANDLRAPILHLSGGNQQKISIAKWLETSPRVIILDEPTRGVDVGAKREIYSLIHRLASEGTACILISSELPEIVGMCHRVIVMRDGRTVAELEGEQINENEIMRHAAGVAAA